MRDTLKRWFITYPAAIVDLVWFLYMTAMGILTLCCMGAVIWTVIRYCLGLPTR